MFFFWGGRYIFIRIWFLFFFFLLLKPPFSRKQGQPNCTQTEDECDASCNLQYQKCNVTTKQCVNCDRSSDPDCKQSAGDCDRTCSQTNYGICDPISGKCQTCEPTQTGCVQNCNDTCSQVKNFYCNSTTFQCIIGGGNQTLEECAENCYNSTETMYSCVWNTSQPQCMQDPAGHFSKQDCETNCKQPDYAKCNFSTGMCEDCNPQLDPDCKYTQAYCNASCKPSEILGTWRGIQINQNYDYGEWDFTFNADQTVCVLCCCVVCFVFCVLCCVLCCVCCVLCVVLCGVLCVCVCVCCGCNDC